MFLKGSKFPNCNYPWKGLNISYSTNEFSPTKLSSDANFLGMISYSTKRDEKGNAYMDVANKLISNICMLKILQIKYFHRQATLLKGHVYCMELYNKCIWILDEHCKIQNVQWLSHDQLMGRLVSIIDSKI